MSIDPKAKKLVIKKQYTEWKKLEKS
jgi:hypothetical protein